ncbi:MAG: hypothetical protein ACYDH5_20055 [Acidimicrobiales bacterium]
MPCGHPRDHLPDLDKLARKAPLDTAEARRLRTTDLIAEGQRQGSARRLTLVVEVSSTLHVDDVARAAKSAEVIEHRSMRSMAIAAGRDLGGTEVAEEAARRNVALLQVS